MEFEKKMTLLIHHLTWAFRTAVCRKDTTFQKIVRYGYMLFVKKTIATKQARNCIVNLVWLQATEEHGVRESHSFQYPINVRYSNKKSPKIASKSRLKQLSKVWTPDFWLFLFSLFLACYCFYLIRNPNRYASYLNSIRHLFSRWSMFKLHKLFSKKKKKAKWWNRWK